MEKVWNKEGYTKLFLYLGTHQHLAVDIDIGVSGNGGIQMRSGDQRFYERLIGFRFPRLLSAAAEVCEWYDDASESFQIDVRVSNRMMDPILSYSGSFDVTYIDMPPEEIPADVKPVKEEVRE